MYFRYIEKNSLDNIMLQVFFIDDDKPTTIVNKRLAKRSELFDRIEVFNNSAKAFEYLLEHKENTENLPDLIFLDVNMPAFNGWEFLEAFQKNNFKKEIRIVMLSTSDSNKVVGKEDISHMLSHYETKPLTIEKIKNHAAKII